MPFHAYVILPKTVGQNPLPDTQPGTSYTGSTTALPVIPDRVRTGRYLKNYIAPNGTEVPCYRGFAPVPLYPTGFGPGTVLSGKKNGTPKLFDKPVRDAGGDPTAVLRYADRMGMVKRESERTIRKNVRIGKLQLRCVIIQIPNEEESVLLQLLQLQPKKGKK